MVGAASIETPLLKVPYESLKRAAKDRKTVVDDASRVLSDLASEGGADLRAMSGEQRVQALDKLVVRLQGIKRKLDEISRTEQECAHKCHVRLRHLVELGEPEEDQVVAWNMERFDCILVDHMLRTGCHNSAFCLAKSSNIEDLVDSNVFLSARRVVEGLKRHDCAEALAWCAANQAKLRRNKSKLEFKLHVQVFIEYVRQERMLDAIAYARKHLSQWASLYMEELQRAIAALAFRGTTTCPRYLELFDDSQWDQVINLFHADLFKLNCLTPESLLTIHLQAGLCALKTPQSYEQGCSGEDPLCLPVFQKLAEGLPYAKYDRSRLVCSVTREVMNEQNPPNVLPNGYVYSQAAIDGLKDISGKVTCPKTGDVCDESDVRRVFVL
ncbi:unnamed protein product [Ostreobium quekettii]|uniref:Macrophage erythroblast attacher n=1 Tax=Ostreobium quekettii TaxID=121088 RepID=A0A8S1JAK2_9CHLO|nr:unnamed protein product [Ostreobium quekettii]|eukprot:evm.model.scf_17.12 EVM.evm.TU.scf_17.12   scf_17:230837-234883(-)